MVQCTFQKFVSPNPEYFLMLYRICYLLNIPFMILVVSVLFLFYFKNYIIFAGWLLTETAFQMLNFLVNRQYKVLKLYIFIKTLKLFC